MKILITTIGIVLFIGALFFAPIVPIDLVVDSKNNVVPEERIDLELSNDDLLNLIKTARGGPFVSLFGYFLGAVNLPLLYVTPTESTWQRGQTPNDRDLVEVKPLGDVEVNFGYICGELCGSGIKIILVKSNGKWVIVESANWIS
ncbi:hypothetical protein NBRC116493_36020 [Aurantivibrio infirmus]